MAGPITPAKLVGVGKIFDIDNNVCLSNQAEFAIVTTVEELSIPNGDDFGDSSIGINQLYSGRIAFRDLTSEIVAAMIAGTTTTGSTDLILKEAKTISTTPCKVTLDEDPWKPTGATFAPIEVLDQNGVTYKQVSDAPAAAGEFKDGTVANELEFHDDDTGKNIAVTYWWANPDGVTVKPNPAAIPTNGRYVFSGKLWSSRKNGFVGFMTCYMAKLQRTGDLGFGTPVKDAGNFGFDFKVTVTVPDDLQISFPQA